MKDFDEKRRDREQRDRSFQIGGETFTRRPSAAPEGIMRWSKASSGELHDELTAYSVPRLTKDGDPILAPDGTATMMLLLPEETWLEVFDQTILALLEPGQEEKWARVRDPDLPNPVSLEDLRDLLEWLLSEMTGRPTGQPSGSGSGASSTGTSSTDGSSSPVVPGAREA